MFHKTQQSHSSQTFFIKTKFTDFQGNSSLQFTPRSRNRETLIGVFRQLSEPGI